MNGPQSRYDQYCEHFAAQHPASVAPEIVRTDRVEGNEMGADWERLDWNENYSNFSSSARYSIAPEWHANHFWQLPDGRVAVEFRDRWASCMFRIWADFDQARAYAVPMPINIYLHG